MASSHTLHEDDVDHAAKLAGITLTPEFRRGILERLQELRKGVLRFAEDVGEEAGPAVRFSAE
jgi:hypothetical protein